MFRKKLEVTDSTIDIAKTIVNRCLRRGYEIYPSKLQRMMVIAYGEYLVKTGKRLFDSSILVSNLVIKVKDIHESFGEYYKFRHPFYDDKMFFADQEETLNNVIYKYGNKNFSYIDSDSRIMALKELARITKKVSDKDIQIIFEKHMSI